MGQIPELTENDLRAYHRSRTEFDRYAAYGGPITEEVFPDRVRRMSHALHRWEKKNFGLQPDWTGFAGIIEELGEYEEARDVDAQVDAIGDVMVFMSNFCFKVRLDFSELLYLRETCSNRPFLTILYGRFAHVVLKASQKIRGMEDKELYRKNLSVIFRQILALVDYMNPSDKDLVDIFEETGTEVLKRDWTKK